MSTEAKPEEKTTATVVAPVPGTAEYEAAMAAKFEKHQAGETANASNADAPAAPAKVEKPAEVPEKFWDAEKGVVNYAAWSKSTAEAERKITELSAADKGAADAKAKADAEAKAKVDAEAATKRAAELAAMTPEDRAKAEAEDAKKVADAATAAKAAEEAAKAAASRVSQEDMNKFSTEFQTNGKLSDETYKKLSDAGIGREYVDSYIAGQQAIADRTRSTLVAEAGGEEAWTTMSKWAAANMKPAEVTALNTALAGSMDEAKLAVAGLKGRYEASNGKPPQLLGGNTGAESQVGYASMADYKADLKNPLYGKDEAFTNAVIAKVSKTTAF